MFVALDVAEYVFINPYLLYVRTRRNPRHGSRGIIILNLTNLHSQYSKLQLMLEGGPVVAPTNLNSLRGDSPDTVQPYAYYALAVLATTGFLNYLDRQILATLAQSLKIDLHLSDAQLGFLLGTAFAVFYSIVGVAIGRIADAVDQLGSWRRDWQSGRS